MLFLDHSNRRGQVQRHAPAALNCLDNLGTHCTGGWVGPTADLDRCGKPHLHRDSIPGPSIPYPVAMYLRYRPTRLIKQVWMKWRIQGTVPSAMCHYLELWAMKIILWSVTWNILPNALRFENCLAVDWNLLVEICLNVILTKNET